MIAGHDAQDKGLIADELVEKLTRDAGHIFRLSMEYCSTETTSNAGETHSTSERGITPKADVSAK